MKKQYTCTPRTKLDTCPHCGGTKKPDAVKLTDFILFSQSEFVLNLSRELNRGNISFGQFFLLSYMTTSPTELTMSDIARKMGHSTAAATGLVDRLEKLGYVERTHAIDDRRKVLVRITSQGVGLVIRLRDELTARIDEKLEEGWDGESSSVE